MSPRYTSHWAEADTEDILPSQWKDLHASGLATPEKKLAAAVLADAVATITSRSPAIPLHKHGPRSIPHLKAQLVAEDQAWMASNDDLSPFSYLSICMTLGINPGALRKELLRHDADLRRIGRQVRNAAESVTRCRMEVPGDREERAERMRSNSRAFRKRIAATRLNSHSGARQNGNGSNTGVRLVPDEAELSRTGDGIPILRDVLEENSCGDETDGHRSSEG